MDHVSDTKQKRNETHSNEYVHFERHSNLKKIKTHTSSSSNRRRFECETPGKYTAINILNYKFDNRLQW